MLQFALLAMQAAGMVTDYYAVQQEKLMGRMGENLTQAAINSNIEMLRAKTEDESAMAMERLRQSIGSQIAYNAARGTQSGAGSALSTMKDSEKAARDDERSRRMNLLQSESQLRAKGVLSGLHQLKSETELGRKLTKDIFKTIPTDPESVEKIGSNLKSEYSSFKKSFGMTSI